MSDISFRDQLVTVLKQIAEKTSTADTMLDGKDTNTKIVELLKITGKGV